MQSRFSYVSNFILFRFFFKNEPTYDDDEDREGAESAEVGGASSATVTPSTDFQWELVSDDAALVPVFRGAITAECVPALDSPE